MPLNDELVFAPAYRLAAMLRGRKVSSSEMVSAFLERIEAINPKLNAVVTLVEERAIEEAAESDRRLGGKGEVRPLEGLPITVKDAIYLEGVRATDGMKIYEHHVPSEDAPAVARLRAAGAVAIAKTNVPEMCLDYDCDNPVFGATNNPWNLERVPGGSSGGEAAALAAGLSPLGLGSDFGGSIRVPSHFCGTAGLKPSWGTIPGNGHMPGPLAPPPVVHMSTIGPMARCVEDLTLAYNLIRGAHPSNPYAVPSDEAHPERVHLKTLNCALFTESGGVPVAAEIRAAVERAGRALVKRGVAVEEKRPPIERAHQLWADYAMADGGAGLKAALGDKLHLSRPRLRSFLASAGAPKSAEEFFNISIERDLMRTQLADFMERYPLIVTAPFCVTAFPHGATEVAIDGANYPLFAANWPALWVNFAGLPAAIVPAGQDRGGLPIGVQIVGRAFHEEQVLALALALEQELGGFKAPPLA